jgi:exopolyphosphatase/guanosine-5'-triphosphate,3'-diphosphate pyrophosphatase
MIKLAAIDIGSNAVRLMLSRVYENGSETSFIKESLVRIPLRLGEDVFSHGRITKEKTEKLATIMEAFRRLIIAYGAADYMACATSAIREAANRASIIKLIKKRSGLDVEVIEGKREAAIIFSNHIRYSFNAKSSLLYIDVGGGSTELTLLSKSRIVFSSSFKIGTVRMLKNSVRKQEWEKMRNWLKTNVAPQTMIAAVGTGGSINNIFRLSRKKEGKPLTYKQIKDIKDYLDSFTVEERIKVLGLRPDRADVIVHATEIYIAVMKWAGIRMMFVPIMGLSDGLINVLYEKIKSKEIEF